MPEGDDDPTRAISGLDEFLRQHPDATHTVLDLLSKRLSGPINSGTWRPIYNGLLTYLGKEPFSLALWVVSGEHDKHLQELQERGASSRVLDFFRDILGRLGPELERAYDVYDELDEDWRRIGADIYYDRRRGRPVFRLRIEKNNGETAKFEMVGRSLLTLIRYLMGYLREQQTPDIFDQQPVKLLLEELRTLQQFFSPAEETVREMGAPGGAEGTARSPSPVETSR